LTRSHEVLISQLKHKVMISSVERKIAFHEENLELWNSSVARRNLRFRSTDQVYQTGWA